MLIGDIIRDCRTMAPDATAATLGTESLTFAELDHLADAVAATLQARGVRPGDRLAWCTPTHLHSLAAFIAAARIGAIFCPLNPREAPETLRGQLELIEPRLTITNPATVDGSPAHPGTPEPPAHPHPHPDDAHIMYLTSGSTGAPKGVLVSHRATYLRSCPGSGTSGGGIHGDGGLLSSFPLSHYGGWHYVVEAWLCRTAIHLIHRADAAEILSVLTRHRPSALYAIPAVWDRILAALPPSSTALHCLRHADTGTSRFELSLLDRIRAAAPNAAVSVLYGASETGPICRRSPWHTPDNPHSVGRPVPPGTLTLASISGNDAELLFSSPTLMNGYFRDARRTDAVLTKDPATGTTWYHTGDLATIDSSGYVTLTGRTREVIRTGGETVPPSDVELMLAQLPAVADCGVVGVPDPTWGELVCAFVVTAPGHTLPTPKDVRQAFPDVPACRIPRRIYPIDAIPRTTATGQVRRSALRDRS